MQIAFACVFALTAAPIRAESFSFDDVTFWVGSGTNRAALVIDWVEGTTDPPALAWGYRWDSAATGRDMLRAIVAADDRLFAKLGGSPANPLAVYGLGYDANADGQFAIDDGTLFDADGLAFSGPADLATSIHPPDYYAEGWFTAFWHYGVAPTNPYDGGTWSDTPVGMAGRALADGAWDSWTFSPTFNFAAFAENPQAAAPPPGDFNGDGRVTALDYDVWKAAFGSTAKTLADANGNGIVDAADYTIWRNNLGPATNPPTSFGLSVPEPPLIGLALCPLLVLPLVRFSQRKETNL